MTSLGGRRWRVLSLTAAGLITAAVLAIQFADNELANRVVLFYVLPVVIVADQFGWRAGVLAGLLGFSIDLGRDQIQGDDIALGLHLARGVVLVLVGALTGSLAERTRRALLEAKGAARHFELSHDLACTADLEGRLIQVNDSWTECLGWTREELLGRTFADLVHPDDREATAAEVARVNAGGSSTKFVNRYRHKDGGWRHIEWASRSDVESGLIFAAARDVTDRVAAEVARGEAEERFRRAFEDSPIGIALVGLRGEAAGKLLEANETLGEMLGYSPMELVGKRTLREFTHPDDREVVGAGVERVSAGELTTFRCELRLKRRNGTHVWVEFSTSVLQGQDGEPLYRLSQLHDIDIRRRTEDQLRRLADHDSLTDLFNRRRFHADLERELAPSHPDRQGAVLMIDVDGLKEINDRLGHAAGDSVLIGLAEELRDSLRSGDVAARLGGDEFAVLLRRVDTAGARLVAEKLLEAAQARLADPRGPSAGLGGLSIGVAAFGDGDGTTSPEQLLETADRAMYEAKAGGGGRASQAATAPAAARAPEHPNT